jgi:hypothetical protein
MGKKDKNQGDLLYNYSVQKAIREIVRQHPQFEGSEKYLTKSLDKDLLEEKYYKLSQKADEKELDNNAKSIYISKGISNYILNGFAFDEQGRKVILKKGLEEKIEVDKEGFWNRLFKKKETIETGKYLNNTIKAFDDLTDLMKSGDYAERMPEVSKAITTLYDLKFLDPATDILKEYGLINEEKHAFLKKNIYNKAQEASKEAVTNIEKYVVPQKIAASIIGFIGVMLMLFNLDITGAVIGGDSTVTIGIVGVFMILFAFLLYLRPFKKSFKK